MNLNRIIRSTCGVVAVLALAVSAAGCGASDKSSGTSGSGSAAAKKWADEAATRLAKFQSDPGTINVSEPLPGKPAAGKKVHFLVLNLPTTQIAQEGMKAAAKAVGWDLTTVLLDPTDAQAFSAGVEQAIAAKADYIVGAALSLATAGDAVAKAKAADTASLAVREGVQMHGGIGMTDEHDIGLFMKRETVLGELFGDVYYHRNRVAELSGY